jgi:hypothetical protein
MQELRMSGALLDYLLASQRCAFSTMSSLKVSAEAPTKSPHCGHHGFRNQAIVRGGFAGERSPRSHERK